jgi:hypothetical protein
MRTHLDRESRKRNTASRDFDVFRAGRPESARRATRSWPDRHAAAGGHGLSGIRILPERSGDRASLAAPPENVAPAPAPPAAGQQAASATKPPVLESGEVEIKDDGNAFTSDVAYFAGMTVYDVGSNFTVQTKNVKVQQDSPGAFVYGLVQNVLFDHFEATYSKGDMLVDSVGPFLDIWPTDPAPFFHEGGGDNPVYPSSLFTQLSVSAKFTDKPSWPLKPRERFCGEQVSLKTAARTIAFRVGLVARHVGTGELFQLGAAAKTYMIKWRAEIDTATAARTLKSENQIKGTYELDKPGVKLELAPPTAVTEVNKAEDAATKEMESRCENVL